MNRLLKLLISSALLIPALASADEHGHTEKSGATQKEAHDDDHGHEEGGHEAGEHREEGSAAVGPDKGILAANETDGFKLSVEALKNFGIKTVPATTASLKLARSSIFFGLEERNLYRVRNGFFKRIDFKTVSKTKSEFVVTSTDLREGDQVAISGLGFLRISELAAFGGVAEGHSH